LPIPLDSTFTGPASTSSIRLKVSSVAIVATQAVAFQRGEIPWGAPAWISSTTLAG
jgi:membrane-bound lytic murein transglycosylase